jgi:asparagine synthase (glutamine-hydrolysing)
MCGIAGKVWHDGSRPVEPDLLARMAASIRHRGPDDEGIWTAPGVGLVHRRLAVIDLSPRGHQPMASADGALHIVFNGEIYNHRELRRELAARGRTFRSDSDTEVLLHLYEEDGVGMLERLRGMFAFAIWDARTRTLFAARDRLGKKPFHYLHDGEKFLFASEPRAILRDPAVSAAPDGRAIGHYLTFGYVPGAHSALRGFNKLPPAHYLLLRDGALDVRRYWDVRFLPKRREPEAELEARLIDLLEESVRLRMISDVPLGALLSGGVDSSLVVALMKRVGAGTVRTFSIGFEEPRYDELPHARAVANHLGTEHEELVVRPDAAALVPRLVWHYGEPFADSSALPTFLLSEMTRRSVTVALGGDGGDESFAGYDRYRATALAGISDVLPQVVRRAVADAAARIAVTGTPKSLPYRAHRFLEVLSRDPRRRYAAWIVYFDQQRKLDLCTPEYLEAHGGFDSLDLLDEAFARSDAPSVVEGAQHFDLQHYLPDDLLVKVDVASMAHALEVRSPLLDHHVVEFAASLPERLKMRGLVQKRILKRISRDLLPSGILERRKMGFGVPIDRWLRRELRDMAGDVLLSPRAQQRGYFRPERVRALFEDHVSGRAVEHFRLWNLLMLELWHREYVDQPVSAEPPGGLAA